MQFIDMNTGEYPVSDRVIRDKYPNTSFPLDMSEVNLEDFGYSFVVQTPVPEYDRSKKKVIEDSPILVDNIYYQAWLVVDKTPEEIQADVAITISRYTSALDAFIDSEARKDRWDNRVTAAMRAGYPNPWQDRAKVFVDWMDNQCYPLGIQIMNEVQAGERELPTIEEFLNMMPKMEWSV